MERDTIYNVQGFVNKGNSNILKIRNRYIFYTTINMESKYSQINPAPILI